MFVQYEGETRDPVHAHPARQAGLVAGVDRCHGNAERLQGLHKAPPRRGRAHTVKAPVSVEQDQCWSVNTLLEDVIFEVSENNLNVLGRVSNMSLRSIYRTTVISSCCHNAFV